MEARLLGRYQPGQLGGRQGSVARERILDSYQEVVEGCCSWEQGRTEKVLKENATGVRGDDDDTL